MVHLGEAQVLEGKMAKALDGVVRSYFAGAYFVEQLAELIGVQGSYRLSVLSQITTRGLWVTRILGSMSAGECRASLGRPDEGVWAYTSRSDDGVQAYRSPGHREFATNRVRYK